MPAFDQHDHQVLQARSIKKAFGRKQVLQEVSLNLFAGELVGLVGENGSGKSTLLRILVGALRADNGAIHISGKLAYCPQKPLLFDDMTVLENFRYFAAAYGLTDGGDESWKARQDELLLFFQYERYKNDRVRFLSGGTRQKLNLSIALLPNPTLLLLDEPYAGFDWETYLRFWEYSTNLLDQQCCILVVTHFIQDQTRFDRILKLKNGQLHETEPRTA